MKAETAKILSFERGPDWDGEGAKSISHETCLAAISFLKCAYSQGFPPPQFISPSTRGAVGFQWGPISIKVFSQDVLICKIGKGNTSWVAHSATTATRPPQSYLIAE